MLDITLKETRVYREAREEGQLAGQLETQRAIALNLLKQGTAVAVIAQATGLTLEQLQLLQTQANQA